MKRRKHTASPAAARIIDASNRFFMFSCFFRYLFSLWHLTRYLLVANGSTIWNLLTISLYPSHWDDESSHLSFEHSSPLSLTNEVSLERTGKMLRTAQSSPLMYLIFVLTLHFGYIQSFRICSSIQRLLPSGGNLNNMKCVPDYEPVQIPQRWKCSLFSS